MIKAVPVRDAAENEKLCGLCGLEYDAGKLAYSVSEDDVPIGFCRFGFKGKNGYIYDIANLSGRYDREALFLLGRAVMNFMDICGSKGVFFDGVDEKNEAFVRALGFKKTGDGCYYTDLKGLFTGGCECKKI